MEVKLTDGDRLLVYMRHEGWTQVRASEVFGVSERTIRAWVKGETHVPKAVLLYLELVGGADGRTLCQAH